MTPLGQSLVAFAIAAALMTVTPGIDTALVLRTAAVEGARRAFLAGLGICLGCLAWGLVTALGLGLLLEASEFAFAALKWAGAAYLFYLGVKLIFGSRDELGSPATLPAQAEGFVWFRRGFLTNMLNPKVGAFYVSFLPQFIPAGANVAATTALLASIHALLGLIWFIALIAATRPLARALSRPGVIRWLDRLTGGLLLAFGAKLALSRN